ncbi:MAG TPA: hypothetical protein VK053_04365 [Jiangellaceae bacterium]|nr:hypothetical protein [Jiangellaceae bacterium]
MPQRRRVLQRALSIGIALSILAVLPSAARSFLPTELPLRNDGLALGPSGEQTVVPPRSGQRFVDGTSVLTGTPDAAEAVAESRAWLAEGPVPGRGTEYEDMAEQALLDLRALVGEDGAVMAAPITIWRYTWPRDSAFVVAALSVTQHHDDAATVLDYLSGIAPEEGWWEARYRPDGEPAGYGNRPPQLDGSGWVPWAVWAWWETHPDTQRAGEALDRYAPMVIDSADTAAEAIGPDGLPPPSSDYWERVETEVTLGTVGPLRAGLRAAVQLAPELDVGPQRAQRWQDALDRLETGIDQHFAPHGYPRTVPDGGADSAIAFLAPPFGPADDDVRVALVEAERALQVRAGGVRPGEDWTKDVGVAWTPSTSSMALAAATTGELALAHQLLGFLDAHRTGLGSLPEKIDSRGMPSSVVPLGWTSAAVLLTLVALEGELPSV